MSTALSFLSTLLIARALPSTTQIEDVHVVRDRATGASKGFGFVKFFDMGVQQRVIDMHEHVIDGRQVMAREAQQYVVVWP